MPRQKLIKYSVARSKVKQNKKTDLLLIQIPTGSVTTQVVTRNKFAAAPIQVAKKHLRQTQPKYIIINSGNANAGTGKQGIKNIGIYLETLASITNVKTNEILPYSTGVIGEQLSVQKIVNTIPFLVSQIGTATIQEAATAIMTTDTYPKYLVKKYTRNNKILTLKAIVKGSGMICPNMATLIGLVTIDCHLSKNELHSVFNQAIESSFNTISVDGDTSTNDGFICIQIPNKKNITDKTFIIQSLTKHLIELSKLVIKDGEGATMLITIIIKNAKTTRQAKAIAKSIAHSPLVKTALHARDPNWGRIVAAIGNANTAFNANLVEIYLGKTICFKHNTVAPSYTEEKGQKEFDKPDLTITINLNQGNEQYRFFTCDLSREYVSINSDYRS